jgi:hypothetical protein
LAVDSETDADDGSFNHESNQQSKRSLVEDEPTASKKPVPDAETKKTEDLPISKK